MSPSVEAARPQLARTARQTSRTTRRAAIAAVQPDSDDDGVLSSSTPTHPARAHSSLLSLKARWMSTDADAEDSPMQTENDEAAASESESEPEGAALVAASRRRNVAPTEVIPAFTFTMAVGGKALTASSVTSFEILDEEFQPLWMHRVDALSSD